MQQPSLEEKKQKKVQMMLDDDDSDSETPIKKKEEEKDNENNSFESRDFENHLRTLLKAKISNQLPKATHLKFDTLDLGIENNDFSSEPFRDNLEEWFSRTKLNLADNKEAQLAVNIEDIRNKNSQKILLESMKEKFRSPHLNYNMLDSILNTTESQTQSHIISKSKPSQKLIQRGQTKVLIRSDTSSSPQKFSAPNKTFFSNNNNHNHISNQEGIQSSTSIQINNQFRKAGGINTSNSAINPGNMCTSLTLLQMYNPEKHYVNPEIIKKENVKKIVNTIIQDKMERIMINPKEYFKNQKGKGQSADLDTVHSQTLKNFKNLKKYFNYGQKIDYDTLLSNIVFQKQLPKKLFNFTEEEINPVSTFKDVEPDLLQRYLAINKAIIEKKQQQLILRKEVAKQVERLNELNIEQKFSENRLDTLASQLQMYEKQIKKVQISSVQAPNTSSKQTKQNKANLNEHQQEVIFTMNRLTNQQKESKEEQERIKQQIIELNEACNSMKKNIDAIVEEIDDCDTQVEQLKLSKTNLKTYLRENYIKTIKKDLNSIPYSSKQNISLVWVVKSMNLLNEDISKSSFPQCLDDQSQNFLKQAAVIEQEIDDLRLKIKNQDIQKIDITQKKREQYDKVLLNISKSNTKEEVSKKLKSIMVHNLQVRKPVFQVDGDSKNLEIEWMCDNLNETQTLSLNKNGIDDAEIQQAVQERQRIVDQIQEKQNQYSKLKNVELMRLIALNEKREDSTLLRKCVCLFGTVDGPIEYYNYKNLNQCFLKKVDKNKNFSFSSRNRSIKQRMQSPSQEGNEIKIDMSFVDKSQDKQGSKSIEFIQSEKNLKYIAMIREKQSPSTSQTLNNISNSEDPFEQFMQSKFTRSQSHKLLQAIHNQNTSRNSNSQNQQNIRFSTPEQSQMPQQSSSRTIQFSQAGGSSSQRCQSPTLLTSHFLKPLLFSSTSRR